jgi:hypothetical protein
LEKFNWERRVGLNPNPGVNEPSVRVRTVHFNDRVIAVRYPASGPMDACFDEVFGKQDYPFLPFLAPESTAVIDIGANVGFASSPRK